MDKNLAMTLTLQDQASSKLEKFASILKSLEGSLNSSNQALGRFATDMGGIVTASEKATSTIKALDQGVAASVQGLSSFGGAAAVLGDLMGTLSAVVEKASAAIIGFEAKLTAASSGVSSLGRAAAMAGSEVTGFASKLGSAEASLERIGTKSQASAGHIGDLIKIMAALKVEKEIAESAKEAVGFEAQGTRVRNLKLAPDEQAKLLAGADQAANDVPTLSRIEARKTIFDLHTSFGNVEEAVHNIKEFSERIYNITRATGKEMSDADVQNMAKIVERRGGTTDEKKKKDTLDWIEGTEAGTQGRVNVASLMNNLKQSKNGASIAYTNDFLYMLSAYAEQLQAGGSSAGQTGTYLTQFDNAVMGRGGAANNKMFEARIQAGLIDPAKVIRNKAGNIDQQKSDLSMIDKDLAIANPQAWTDKYGQAAARRMNVDMSDPSKIADFQSSLFKGNGGEIFGMMLNPTTRDLAKKDANIYKNTAKGEEAYGNNTSDPKGTMDQYTKAMSDFKLAIGESILPALTSIITKFNEFLISVGKFGKDNPVITGIATFAAGIASAGVAVMTAFPMLSKLFALLSGGEAAAGLGAAAAGGLASFGEVIAGIVAMVGGLPAIIIAAIAAVAAYFLFDGSLANAQMFWDSLVSMFEERWATIKEMASAVADAIAEILHLQAASDAIASFWDSAKSLWSEATNWVSELVSGWADSVAQVFGFQNAKQALGAFVDAAFALWQQFWSAVGVLADAGLRLVVDHFLFPGAYENLKSFAGSVKGAFMEMFNDIAEVCSKIASAISSAFAWAMNKLGIIRAEAASTAAAVASVSGGGAPAGGHGGAAAPAYSNEGRNAPAAPDPLFAKQPPRPAGGGGGGGGGRRGGGGGGARGGRDVDNIESNLEAETARHEKELLSLSMKETDQLYRDHKLSVEAYYAAKAEAIAKGTSLEIAALERERAVLAKNPAYNVDKIAKVDNQIDTAQRKEKLDLDGLAIEKKNALLSVNKESLTIEQKLQALTGGQSTAKIALLDQEYQQKLKILQVNGQLDAAEALTRLHGSEVAKVGYDDNAKQLALAKEKERTLELAYQSDAKQGYTTAQEATQSLIEAKRALGEEELKNAEAAERFAAAIGDPLLIEKVKQMKMEASDLANTLDAGAQKLKDTMQSAFQGGFEDLMNGKFSFKKFFGGISQSISKEVSKGLSDALTNNLFGAGKDGAGGMLSGLFGQGGSGNFLTALMGGNSFSKGAAGGGNSLSSIFSMAGDSSSTALDLFGGGGAQGGQNGALGAAAKLATDGLKNMTTNGVKAATDGLIQQVSQDALQETSMQAASMALEEFTAALQEASSSLMGSGGGMGDMSSLMGGGEEGGGGGGGWMSLIGSMLSFDVGADSIPRDMIARIHEGEMILPADTASRVRAGMGRSSDDGAQGGGIEQHLHFHVQGTPDKRTTDQIAKAAGGVMQKAVRRNG